ncbi:MAG: hypothetical protein ABR616_09950 [Dermatophilaceae bacterium]
MTEPTATIPATTVLVSRDPDSIRDALDVYTRLDVIASWAEDRKGQIRSWVAGRADVRRAEDGAAPTWRLGDDVGTVLQTDPKPSPKVADRDAFAEWYVREVLADDPDRPNEPGEYLLRFDDHAARQATADVDSDALLAFVDLAEKAVYDDLYVATDDVLAFADRVRTDVRWVVSDDLLDGLLTGKIGGDTPRAKVVGSDESGRAVIDVQTGEQIPGTEVRPPGKRSVQMRPDKRYRGKIRTELDEIVGTATLTG